MKKPIVFLILLTTGLFGSIGCTDKTTNLKHLDNSVMAAPPQTIGFTLQNYSPQPGNTYQNIFVSNFSVITGGNTLQYSTARDGLADEFKLLQTPTYGFAVNRPESVVPGFQDLVLYRLGINLQQTSQLNCAQTQAKANDIFQYQDSRLPGNPQMTIGLRDCSKVLMGLSTNNFDNNSNGIPDYLEIRCGLNPNNKVQAFLSTGADGMTNLEKCRKNLPIGESATSYSNQLYGYQYANTINTDKTSNFVVTNIPVLQDGVDNFIAVYIVETNLATKKSFLYTAYAILKGGYVSRVLTVDYKVLAASGPPINSQIAVP